LRSSENRRAASVAVRRGTLRVYQINQISRFYTDEFGPRYCV
jgi:hypothetical protein